jgi:hypothetical protein
VRKEERQQWQRYLQAISGASQIRGMADSGICENHQQETMNAVEMKRIYRKASKIETRINHGTHHAQSNQSGTANAPKAASERIVARATMELSCTAEET